ncbi:MAG TPA: PEP-CTERM sorting domain-containing protein [Tepidisphaeraceae bacterium]|nr:PEP-CTERM sorting domain-containing protein [Tepidisphaeraceae bacterium]
MKKRLMSACAGVVLAGALGVSTSQAALQISIVDNAGNKELAINAADLNKPITLNVYASVTGAAGNSAAEFLTLFGGSFVSNGTTLGTFAPAGSNVAIENGGTAQAIAMAVKKEIMPGFEFPLYSFADNGAAPGTAADVDGDGDMDLVGNGFRSASQVGYKMVAPGIYAGEDLGNGGVKLLVGKFTFTPSALGGNTTLDFVPLKDESGAIASNAALWAEDGATNLLDGSNGSILTNGFTIIVPEPASMSVLGLGGALLLGRRNRK